MTFQISWQTLAEVTAVSLHSFKNLLPAVNVTGVTTETRSIRKNDRFLALKGDGFDGHRFVQRAIDLGAAGVIVQEPVNAGPQLRVPDTLVAYHAIARWWRQQLNTPLVAITGSVGKTTTKELVAAALSTQGGAVLKTQANYNNEIGVPKTLLALDASHHYGVIEMGMRGPGQIALLTQTTRPNVAVITNVGTAHIELLGSEQAIADAKCELFQGLDTDGVAVLNQNDERLMKTAARVWSGEQITFGLEAGDVAGRLIDSDWLEVEGVKLPLPLPGKHNATNLLAAIAVMQALGLDWQTLQSGLKVDVPSGRSTRVTLPHHLVFLDETYNAGVESMTAALTLLKETPGRRHIAVLGTMKELGAHSVRLHRQVGQAVKDLSLDALFTLAEPTEAAAFASGASPIPTESFHDPHALQKRLKELLQPGDCVLFKASRAIALDQVVNHLKEHFTGPSAPD